MSRRARGVLTGLLLVAMACGGAQGRPLDEWIADVCTDMAAWGRGLQGLSEDLQSRAQGTTNLEEIKAAAVGFFTEATSATDELVSQVRSAGTPDIEDGERVAQILVDSMTEARQLLADARDEVETLPTDDPAALGQGLQEIGTTVGEGFQRVGTAFDEASAEGVGDELTSAADAEPACQELEQLGT